MLLLSAQVCSDQLAVVFEEESEELFEGLRVGVLDAQQLLQSGLGYLESRFSVAAVGSEVNFEVVCLGVEGESRVVEHGDELVVGAVDVDGQVVVVSGQSRQSPVLHVVGDVEKVEEAVRLGACLQTGGVLLDHLGPQFYAPTVLTEVPCQARIWRTETFGPVAAIVKFDSDQQALELANDSSVGLASYFCTRDLSRAFAIAKSLEAGLVGVNEGIMSTALAPFGGVKESGLGREGSTLGIQEYLETKYVYMNC